jgi:histidyl-tRNA synthetase
MEFPLPRGLRDIEPDEMESSEIIRSAFVETSRLFDYDIMEPSSLELLPTLEAKSGPAIRDEIYFFKDKSDREVGLRFDLTVGITRWVVSRRDLSPPVRIGSFAPVWRYDEPQYGKYRWFYQWDAELFGPSSIEADAEVIEFSSVLFRKLGAKPVIRIGSRKILESYIKRELGIEEESRILDAMRAIDKLSKKSQEQIAEEYVTSISKEQLAKLVNFVSPEDSKALQDSLKRYEIDISGLLGIVDSLKSRKVPDVEINLSIVRGIDYYTDMVFEAFDKDNKKLGSLCGGGRYDSLPPIYGRSDWGATGVAGGIERAILSNKFSKRITQRTFVAPVSSDQKLVRRAMSIASELRTEGLAAQSDIVGRSLRKNLETQVAAGTDTVVIVGERELASDSVKVKWLKSGDEVLVSLKDLKRALTT